MWIVVGVGDAKLVLAPLVIQPRPSDGANLKWVLFGSMVTFDDLIAGTEVVAEVVPDEQYAA